MSGNNDYNKTYIKAKLNYYKSEFLLSSLSKTLKEYCDNAYKTIPSSGMKSLRLEQSNHSNEELISIVRTFFYSLNDSEIKNAIDYLIDNKLYRFEPYDSSNPNCKFYKGYTEYTRANNRIENIFITIYRFYTDEDYKTTIHEFGHAIAKIIFNGRENPVFSNFLCENEAFFFELLFLKNYFPSILSDSNTPFILEQKRLIGICNDIWTIKIMDVTFKGLNLSIDINQIKRKLQRLQTVKIITDEFEDSILNANLLKIHNRINSYMLALIQVDRTISDLEKGLYMFKSMQTIDGNEFDTIEELYQKYNTDYTINNPLFEKELENHQKIKQLIGE